MNEFDSVALCIVLDNGKLIDVTVHDTREGAVRELHRYVCQKWEEHEDTLGELMDSHVSHPLFALTQYLASVNTTEQFILTQCPIYTEDTP